MGICVGQVDCIYRTSISMFYNLSDVDNDDYSKILEEGLDPGKIMRVLAKTSTTWKWVDTSVIKLSYLRYDDKM